MAFYQGSAFKLRVQGKNKSNSTELVDFAN